MVLLLILIPILGFIPILDLNLILSLAFFRTGCLVF